MKKIIKFIKNNILGFLVGLSLCLNGVVIAENIITANQVTYNDTTVQAELDSLFDAVDINERLGSTDISSIGDGTVSGAVNLLNNRLNKVENKFVEIAISPGETINFEFDRRFNGLLFTVAVANYGGYNGLYYIALRRTNIAVNVGALIEQTHLGITTDINSMTITNNGQSNAILSLLIMQNNVNVTMTEIE